ncbi:MAG: hypothetical protein AAGI89_02925 [Pseudomonadota bacterium]
MQRRAGTVKNGVGSVHASSLNDAEIKAVAAGLRDLTLPKAQWTHAGHWAAAIVFALEEDEPFEAMAAAIPPYNVATGGENTDTDGYHATITYASMALATMVVARMQDRPLTAMHQAVMASPLGGMDWLKRHYSAERLWSVTARREPMEPDLAPLKDSVQDVTNNHQG